MIKHNIFSRGALAVALTSALLSGCASNEGDDLDKYFIHAGDALKGSVPPLPVVKDYIPEAYNPKHDQADPFLGRVVIKTDGSKSLTPDANRKKDELESFPIGALTLIGSIQRAGEHIAIIKSSDGHVHQVHVGNYIGQDNGKITSIKTNNDSTEVKVKELTQDPNGDGWVERETSILNNSNKGPI